MGHIDHQILTKMDEKHKAEARDDNMAYKYMPVHLSALSKNYKAFMAQHLRWVGTVCYLLKLYAPL